ncbi:MAG: hypothetical protein JWQ04_1959 [Pedosphaera sp.]|nr:hypothetical protein [Pedosphaera sp.]
MLSKNSARIFAIQKTIKQLPPGCDEILEYKTNLDLELPFDSDFLSCLPPISADEMFRYNQKFVEEFNSRPDAEELRLRDKCDVEFVL